MYTPLPLSTDPALCWICGHPVDLKTCKTDEYGNAVHEACYLARMRMNDEALRQLQIRLRSDN